MLHLASFTNSLKSGAWVTFIQSRRRRLIWVVAILVSVSGVMAMHFATREVASKAPVTVRAAGRGGPNFHFQDGRALRVEYRGSEFAAQELRSGGAQPRAASSADLDRNGTPDVVIGYAFGGKGLVTIQRGNPDAFAPTDDSVFARMQQGYDPPSLMPTAESYQVPEPADFVQVGDFNNDNRMDVLVGTRGGNLYLLAGDGQGGLGVAEQVVLNGSISTMAAGEFRAADGKPDVAVAINGANGPQLLVYDGAAGGVTGTPMELKLRHEASAVKFGALDSDPFMDLAVATGSRIEIVHGWGRKRNLSLKSRVEQVDIGATVRGMDTGFFVWNRESKTQLATLSDDGTVRILKRGEQNEQPFTEQEAAARSRGRANQRRDPAGFDIEEVAGWQAAQGVTWKVSQKIAGNPLPLDATAQDLLSTANISSRGGDSLVVLGGNRASFQIIKQVDVAPVNKDKDSVFVQPQSGGGELQAMTLDTNSAPVAALELPAKLNGNRDLLVLQERQSAPNIVPQIATNITVDTTTDNAALNLCTVAPGDCSLRGAIAFANVAANQPATINIPAGTYVLNIDGTTENGLCGNNSIGDLDLDGDGSSLVGAGAATTIIRQSTANDRVICLDPAVSHNRDYSMSGITIAGGREVDTSSVGGGGIIGGAQNDTLVLTNVVIANNQTRTASGPGGGGIEITGGSLTITGSTIGGTNFPGASQTDLTLGNFTEVSGGGVSYSPGDPFGATPSPGTFTVSSSTISHNQADSIAAGGGGLDLYTHNLGTGSVSINTSTLSNNQATGVNAMMQGSGSGGGIVIESIGTTVATTSLTSNTATNLGGGIYVSGGSLTLNGTTPSITFTSNTATNGGSGIGVNVGIDQDMAGNRTINATGGVQLQGTNTNLTGHDIYVATNGAWTNTAGSSMTIGNLVLDSGNNPCGGCVNALMAAFKANNTTSTLTGNWTITGGTFVGDTGTVNVAGTFIFNLASGHGAFTAGSSTVNFNGTVAQSISNGTSINFFNLTDSNTTQPLTLNNSLAVNNSLNVNGANAILSPVAAAVISGTGTLTGSGTARVSRTAATPDFLSQYTITNKTLTNLTIDYNGAGNQTVNNAPAYSHLRISGSGTKTLQGNTSITGNLTIAAATLASGNFNFNLDGNWTNSVGASGFTAGTGTVTFDGTGVVQALSGNTTFFNLTLNNSSSTTQFGTTATTIANNLVASAGSMQADTSTIIFTGGAGSISGAAVKRFNNLQINSGAIISNSTGGDTTIFNDYQNGGTFTQAAGLTTTFASGDGTHSFSGAGTTTFGVVVINGSNTVDAGSHNFNVVGASFTVNGTFTGNTGTVTFNGGVAQAISGDGTKNFGGLTINNGSGVTVNNGTGAVDASVSGVLTLTTDLSVTAGAILQQSGTSAGAADVIGTVRRTDLGVTERAFGNLNNTITINSGTPPTQMDFNLVKSTPAGFPAGVAVVPRDYTLTPTGGSGISATVKLRYIDPTELAGITESKLILWKNIASTWTPQGGTVNTGSNFVSLSGVSSFSEWAIAEGADLTVSKANNVSNAAVVGQQWTWTLTVNNAGGAPADFGHDQTILTDNLPNSSNITYGTLVVSDPNINCSIDGSKDLTCTAGASGASIAEGGSFTVQIPSTASAVGTYQNPRAGGNVTVDPGNVIVESTESNNTAATNTVTVTAASTTTTITSDNPDPSVTGQAVTVQWSVTVNAPGSLGAALTGNVTVSDGTNSCMAAVSAGQCDITFTSAGAKSITAQYAGDTNYNGSTSTPATMHTVNKADTTTTITSDNPDPSTSGEAVTVNYTVSANAPGSGTPTGNVMVTVSGGAETCTGTVAAGTCMLTLTGTGNRTITAMYEGDLNYNTSSDTEDHSVVATTVKVQDAQVGEPTSGSTNMVFTVTLSAPAPGSASVDFTTADETPGPGKAVAGTCGNPGADYVTTSGTVNFVAGEQLKTILVPVCADTDNAEPNETFLVNLSNPTSLGITDGTATGTITAANAAGTFLISELRTSGPGGLGDDFVELYNNTDSPLTVAASDASAGYGLFKMGADCNATPVLIGTIPNGTIIPARAHYLFVGSAYSLGAYANGTLTLTSDIENDRNVAVFSTADINAISSTNRLDAVGFGTNTGNVCDLLREGTNLGLLLGSTLEYSFFRKECDFVGGVGCSTPGTPKDTNNNAADFLFADTAATLVAGAGQHLGAPGPENDGLASPIKRDSTIDVILLDGSVAKTSPPNRIRDLTTDPGNNSTFGTLSVRRRVQNNTGAAVTRLRFRVVEITTAPPPGGIADLRLRTSLTVGSVTVNDSATCAATGTPGTAPCTVTVQGLTLESPPAQAMGGGYNATVSAGTITLGTPLATGASINVQFLLGVQQTGNFRFLVIVEALP